MLLCDLIPDDKLSFSDQFSEKAFYLSSTASNNSGRVLIPIVCIFQSNMVLYFHIQTKTLKTIPPFSFLFSLFAFTALFSFVSMLVCLTCSPKHHHHYILSFNLTNPQLLPSF
jgi:hypothetical protein